MNKKKKIKSECAQESQECRSQKAKTKIKQTCMLEMKKLNDKRKQYKISQIDMTKKNEGYQGQKIKSTKHYILASIETKKNNNK